MQNYQGYFMNSFFKNPQMLIQQMMNDRVVASNPMAKEAIELMQKGDSKGLEELAINLCKEKGINPDEAIQQIKARFGM